MSHRQRQSRRRDGAAAAAARCCSRFGVLAITCAIGVMSLAGYVMAVAATAPDLDELKPVDKGETR